MSKRTKGTCGYCGKTYTKNPMVKHVLSCEVRQKEIDNAINQKTTGCFVLLITGKYSPQYWLITEVNGGAKLKDLDQFLRDIWLECCGHLSGFSIAGERYESHPQATEGWGMKLVKVWNILHIVYRSRAIRLMRSVSSPIWTKKQLKKQLRNIQ